MGSTKPPAGWRVTTIDEPPTLLIAQVLNCQQVYRWLTPAQRAALLTAADGPASGHPRVLAVLRQRGLLLDNGHPDHVHHATTAGRLVIKWNQPSTVEDK
ncbi:MAG TPA: hypothetical protein VFC00_40720 [Micromonosporaceae bacterium]|nr:hypothetical protein [Micromonosporaceae bacterium]